MYFLVRLFISASRVANTALRLLKLPSVRLVRLAIIVVCVIYPTPLVMFVIGLPAGDFSDDHVRLARRQTATILLHACYQTQHVLRARSQFPLGIHLACGHLVPINARETQIRD